VCVIFWGVQAGAGCPNALCLGWCPRRQRRHKHASFDRRSAERRCVQGARHGKRAGKNKRCTDTASLPGYVRRDTRIPAFFRRDARIPAIRALRRFSAGMRVSQRENAWIRDFICVSRNAYTGGTPTGYVFFFFAYPGGNSAGCGTHAGGNPPGYGVLLPRHSYHCAPNIRGSSVSWLLINNIFLTRGTLSLAPLPPSPLCYSHDY
jgi:hypothetical protein